LILPVSEYFGITMAVVVRNTFLDVPTHKFLNFEEPSSLERRSHSVPRTWKPAMAAEAESESVFAPGEAVVNKDGIGAFLVIDILFAKGLGKLSDFGDKIDPYIKVSVGGEVRKTTSRENEGKPVYNARFIIPVAPDQLDDAEIRLEVFDRDTVGSDDFKAGVTLPLPASFDAFTGRIQFDEKTVEDSHPSVEVTYMLVTLEDLLNVPGRLAAYEATIEVMKADDEEDERLKAELAAQIEEMQTQDEEDEAEKQALIEQLNAANADIEAAQEAEQAARAEKEAAIQASLDEMNQKMQELAVEDAAEDAEFEQTISRLQESNAALQDMLKDTMAKLKEAEERNLELESAAEAKDEHNEVHRKKNKMKQLHKKMKNKFR